MGSFCPKSKSRADADTWMRYHDAKCKSKKIGPYHADLYYGTKRGGVIQIWEKGKSNLERVWPSSDDKKWHQEDSVHFMDYENALDEWKNLKKRGDAIDLMWRNR